MSCSPELNHKPGKRALASFVLSIPDTFPKHLCCTHFCHKHSSLLFIHTTVLHDCGQLNLGAELQNRGQLSSYTWIFDCIGVSTPSAHIVLPYTIFCLFIPLLVQHCTFSLKFLLPSLREISVSKY